MLGREIDPREACRHPRQARHGDLGSTPWQTGSQLHDPTPRPPFAQAQAARRPRLLVRGARSARPWRSAIARVKQPARQPAGHGRAAGAAWSRRSPAATSTGDARNFIALLAENKRLPFLPEIAQHVRAAARPRPRRRRRARSPPPRRWAPASRSAAGRRADEALRPQGARADRGRPFARSVAPWCAQAT